MAYRRGSDLVKRQRCLWLTVTACGVGLAASIGCMRSLWNDFLDPTEVGRFHGKPVTKEIRASLGLQDQEVELINASDPLPEDAVAVATEYRIGPGDIVEFNIHELIRAGGITTETRRVSELGYVSLPLIGRLKISGLTEKELEELVKAKVKELQILPDPIVSVVVRDQQQRQFSIVGYVSRAGRISIPRSDFRMLEAISYAGTIPEEVEKVYVIRRMEKSAEQIGPPAPATARPTTAPSSTKPQVSNGLWGDEDLLLNDLAPEIALPVRAKSPAATRAATTRRSSRKPSVVPGDERRALLEALTPGETAGGSRGDDAPQTPGGPPGPAPANELSKWIWLNGEWVELKEGQAERTEPAAAESAKPDEPSAPQEWEAVTVAGEETRVIAIPLKPLHTGEARYNIVIRPGDVITVPVPEAGKLYYVMGHVRGPGTFRIPTEGITLKAAIASAGGLESFAWPSRCEIARKIGPDQEELHQVDLDRIFAMEDPDIKLKPGDVINVGTHPLAPFMVTIGTGFRTTYGFGFVYDRNFGSIDQYAGKQNPEDRRRAEQQQTFQSLKAAIPGL